MLGDGSLRTHLRFPKEWSPQQTPEMEDGEEYIYIYIYIRINKHHIYIHIYTCVSLSLSVYIHIYTYTYIIYIYIYIYICRGHGARGDQPHGDGVDADPGLDISI